MDVSTVESPAETPQNSAEQSLSDSQPAAKRSNPNTKNPFTSSNARELALRGHEKRKQRLEELRKNAEKPAQDDAEYRLFRLQRTREQLLSLDKDLEACEDEKGKKAIVDAIKALCDVEQKLALRPLPGSRRPGRESTTKRSGEVGPVE